MFNTCAAVTRPHHYRGVARAGQLDSPETARGSVPTQAGSRYNAAMCLRPTDESPPVSPFLMLTFALLILMSACTFYKERPAGSFSEATGGEGLERVFWKNVQAANWVEVERALASNYAGVTSAGTMDRTATLEQYRKWQLKDYALGDLKTELNGTTFVVTYTITLNGVISNGSNRLTTSSFDSAAHDDRVATAKIRMGRDRAQRQPTTIMRAAHAIAAEKRFPHLR